MLQVFVLRVTITKGCLVSLCLHGASRRHHRCVVEKCKHCPNTKGMIKTTVTTHPVWPLTTPRPPSIGR
ncbi:hypothetical protein QVD17_32145 [Tagetes erecta]|uniref:Uncharacterized protein n=1 Tax=Tagetes erecta TaxID=13708 RepID=A0AAD8K5Q6_TARER|nr:hypothetical protein QVD17_32145 [Tagetes erecta]